MTDAGPDAQDTEDMVRLAAGHDAALNELMERHGEKLFHYLIRCLQDEEEEADLAQETFVRVYQHRAKFDSGQKFSTWLYTIASNLVRDRHRWRARHPQVSLNAEHEETGTELGARLAHPGASPRESLETTERVASHPACRDGAAGGAPCPAAARRIRGQATGRDRPDFALLGQGGRNPHLPGAEATADGFGLPVWAGRVVTAFASVRKRAVPDFLEGGLSGLQMLSLSMQ